MLDTRLTFIFQYVKELFTFVISRCVGLEPKDSPERITSKIAKNKTQMVEDIGVEPMTLCVQGRCSSQLS
jgi:hypothetical protein